MLLNIFFHIPDAKEVVLQEWSVRLKQLEKQKAELQDKKDNIEQLRTKTLKDNATAIKKWEKALETAKKKYDDKKKQFNEIDIDIKSREALIADCQKVSKNTCDVMCVKGKKIFCVSLWGAIIIYLTFMLMEIVLTLALVFILF